MIDPKFLAKLVCPTSRQPLCLASTSQLAAINRAIAGGAHTRGGTAISAAFEAALVSAEAVAVPRAS
jgi:uncharacterized protein YbaR (Trm112 family)